MGKPKSKQVDWLLDEYGNVIRRPKGKQKNKRGFQLPSITMNYLQDKSKKRNIIVRWVRKLKSMFYKP